MLMYANSYAMPNWPLVEAAGTFSLVSPTNASSKSWMVVRAVARHERHAAPIHQLDEQRAQAILDQMRPREQDDRPVLLARGGHRLRHRREYRIARSPADQKYAPPHPFGNTRSPCFTLLLRVRSGYVRMRAESNALISTFVFHRSAEKWNDGILECWGRELSAHYSIIPHFNVHYFRSLSNRLMHSTMQRIV